MRTALREMRDLPPAVVLNLYGTGLGIARSLGRHGISVIGISSSAEAPGRGTRYATHLVGPDSERDPEGLKTFLLELARARPRKSVLFPTRDQDLIFLEDWRKSLEPSFVFAQPEGPLFRRILDKVQLMEHARAAGIAAPRTWRIVSEESLEAAGKGITFPAVLKPVQAVRWRRPGVWEAAGSRKGIRVTSQDDLRAAYRRVARYEAEALVQEWVPGGEDEFFIYGAYYDRAGRAAAEFTARKLLQYPPEFGLGCLVQSVRHREVMELGRRLLESLAFRGVAEVELKRNPQTGEYCLIEINPRHWDQHELGARCGANISWAAYRDLAELDTERDSLRSTHQRRTVYWVGEQGLWGSLKQDLRGGRLHVLRLALRAAFSSKVFALWSWRDPGPAWNALVRRRRHAAHPPTTAVPSTAQGPQTPGAMSGV